LLPSTGQNCSRSRGGIAELRHATFGLVHLGSRTPVATDDEEHREDEKGTKQEGTKNNTHDAAMAEILRRVSSKDYLCRCGAAN
jgi:hypothetical protein